MIPGMQTISDVMRIGSARGYLIAVLGSLIGAAVGGLTAGGLAAVVLTCEGTGFECLGVALVVFAVGIVAAFAASLGGCYAGLRLRAHDRAGRTTAFLAALLPVAFVLTVLVPDAVGILAPVAAIAGAAIAARRLAIGSPGDRFVIDTKGDTT